jgi:hypothetical protein
MSFTPHLFVSRTIVLIAIFSCFAASAEPAPEVTPAVTVRGRHVIAERITPRGRAVFFGISRGDTGDAGGIGVRITRQVTSDDDGDGRIEFDAGYDIPLRAVWAVVDFASGAYALAAPPDFNLLERALEPDALKRDESGGRAFLIAARSRMAMLIVRPGDGAWYTLGFLGGAGDAKKDSLGEHLTLAFEDATSLLDDSSRKAPRHLKDGDVLIGVDPGRLDVFAMVVAK